MTKKQQTILKSAKRIFDKVLVEAYRLKEKNPQQHLDFLAAYDSMVEELRSKHED